MNFEELQGLKQYVGFDSNTIDALVHLHGLADSSIENIVDDFYATIQQHPEARGAISGGEAQVKRLKQTLIDWLHSTLLGPFDEGYLIARSRIGEVHVRIRLPQRFMLTAMNRIRAGLLDVIDERVEPAATRRACTRAVNQILDIELAIMLDSYHEHWVTRARNNERLGTIGQLAATIAHELRNPLGIVQSSLFLLHSRLSKLELEDRTLDKHLDRISLQVTACGNAISGLLEMARDSQPRKVPNNLRELISSSLEVVSLPDAVTIDNQVGSGVIVFADPQQLKQVITNLADNAVTAMQQEGTVTITARELNGGVEMLFSDDGPGVPPDLSERIFDVLYTTHATGTGLGLALCRKIVHGHDGELSLIKDHAPGAQFRLWLPSGPI